MLPGAGEVGVKVYAEPHVAHHEEGRPAFGRRQVARVALCLSLCLLHVAHPCRGVADVSAVLGFTVRGEQGGLPVRGGTLLGFPHEAAAAVKVYAPGAGAAVRFVVGDTALKTVGAAATGSGIGPGHIQQVA